MQNHLFAVNVYQRCYVLVHMSIEINLQFYSMCSKYPPSVPTHTLNTACRCLMLCKMFSWCYRRKIHTKTHCLMAILQKNPGLPVHPWFSWKEF